MSTNQQIMFLFKNQHFFVLGPFALFSSKSLSSVFHAICDRIVQYFFLKICQEWFLPSTQIFPDEQHPILQNKLLNNSTGNGLRPGVDASIKIFGKCAIFVRFLTNFRQKFGDFLEIQG
jgi:hypothetical protein